MHIVDIFENVYILVFIDDMIFKTMKKNSRIPQEIFLFWDIIICHHNAFQLQLLLVHTLHHARWTGWQGDLWWWNMDSSVLHLIPPVSKSTPLFKTTTKVVKYKPANNKTEWNPKHPGSYNWGTNTKTKAKLYLRVWCLQAGVNNAHLGVNSILWVLREKFIF